MHGGQQLALFNTHAGGHCFQPIHIIEATSGKPILSLIRPGKRPAGEEAARVLRYVIHRIRRHWPKVRILIRGDSHNCAPDVLDLLHRLKCDFILGLAINPTLNKLAEPWREQCLRRWWPGRQVRRFHQFTYGVGSWAQTEKVTARVETTDNGSDARFVVTNLPGSAKILYEKVYCARGRMDNLIKDMKRYTRVVSKTRASARQDRVPSLGSQYTRQPSAISPPASAPTNLDRRGRAPPEPRSSTLNASPASSPATAVNPADGARPKQPSRVKWRR